MKNTRELSVYHGWAVLIITIVLMIFIAFPAQFFFGIYGLAITEFMILAIALIGALVLRADFRRTFSFKLPPVKSFFGGLFVFAGAYLLVLAVLITTEFFFPSIQEVSGGISAVGREASPFVTLFIMAVMPAFCEEVLHRGLIMSSFKHVKRRGVTVLLSALAFGLFHLDPYRFLSTALLGAALAYMANKTDSLVLPVIFHFITNALSVFAIFSSNSETAAEQLTISGGILISFWCFYGGISLVMIYIGWLLFREKGNVVSNKQNVAVILTGSFLFIAGIILVSVFAGETGIGMGEPESAVQAFFAFLKL